VPINPASSRNYKPPAFSRWSLTSLGFVGDNMNREAFQYCKEIAIGDDGIFGNDIDTSEQNDELKLRESVAAQDYDNYLDSIRYSHSIPVMDYEVDRFLQEVPQDSVILDIGGCWGWHWRRLSQTRPDVGVVIVDFVRSNLIHAKNVLGDLVGTNIALLHADATKLPFSGENKFDAVWTVQTFQHILDFEGAVREAYRLLRGGGYLQTTRSMCSHTGINCGVC